MSDHDHEHGASTGKYLVGFILAVILTLAAFIPVMRGMMSDWAASSKVLYLIGLALIQIVMQIIFFLHLNSGPDAKWNVGTMWFGAFCVFMVIGGTWFAMSHINYNMMSGSAGRIEQPAPLELSPTAGQTIVPNAQTAEPETQSTVPSE